VDWVTEAGAGGRVVSVMESVYDEEHSDERAILDGMTAADLAEALKEQREDVLALLVETDDDDDKDTHVDDETGSVEPPAVTPAEAEEPVVEPVEQTTTTETSPEGEKTDDDAEVSEAAKGSKKDPDGDGDNDENEAEDSDLQAEIKRLEKKGLPKNLAVKAAKKNLAEAAEVAEAEEREDAMGFTPEQLQEALESDAFQQHIDAIVEARVRGLVESTLSEERDLMHEEARANAGRQIELRDLRDEAHAQIDEAKLPTAWKAEVKKQFTIEEGRPTSSLDVVDEIDDEGKVLKTARDILTEAVSAEVDRQRSLLAAAAPTRVTGQGANRDENGEKTAKGTGYGALLEEAGFDSDKLDDVWATA